MTSSPSFDSFVEPQQGQLCGAAITTRSRGRCSGNGFRAGRLRSKDLTMVEGAAAFRRQLVLGRVGLGVLQLHLQLVEKPLLAFRAHAIERAPKLFDLQPQSRNQRLGARRRRAERASDRLQPAPRALRSDSRAARSARIIACAAARSEGSESIVSCHLRRESQPRGFVSKNPHPAAVGRQVFCGIRQSMPSSR